MKTNSRRPWALLRTVGRCAALPAALTSPLPGQAVEAEPATLPAVQVRAEPASPVALDEPSFTGSRLGLTPLQTPASIEVLRGETVRERGDTSLLEAASRATGVTMSPSPGNGGTSMAARGFSGHGSVMQLFDGTRLYVASGTITFPFDPWSVERIEVLRGAASVMYGEGAIGAAINIVPKKPRRESIHHEARLAYGSDQTSQLAYGSGGALGESLSYRLDISHRHSDGFMARGDAESLAVGAALRLDVSPRLQLTLSRDEGHQRPQRYYGVPLIDGRLDDRNKALNYNVGDAKLKYRDRWTRLDAQWTPHERLTLRNQLYHLDSKRHWRNAESYAYDADTGLVARDDYLEIGHDQEQVGNRFDATLQQQLGPWEHRLTAGFDLNRIRFQHTNDSPYGGSSEVDPFDFDPGSYVSPVAYTPRMRTRTQTQAFFVESRLAFNPQWSAVGGLRHDRAKVRRSDLVTPANGFEKKFSDTTGRLGVVYAPTPDRSAYAQIARAVDPLGGIVTTSATQAQFDLTSGRQIEVGYKQLLPAQRGAWSLALYHIEKRKLLSRSEQDPSVQQQIGQQSSRGIEATLDLALTGSLRLEANLARLQARFDDFKENVGGTLVSRDGNTPTGVPEQAANAWLDWRFAPQWRAAAGVRHVGKRQVDSANTRQIGSYTVADAVLGWQPNPSLRLGLQVFNLFDRDYPLTTSNAGTQWLLGRPRAVEVSADLRF